jgi:hypothetical protein
LKGTTLIKHIAPGSFFLLLWGLAFFSTPLAARDVFLTIGGGYSPTGNQISLEKNVQLFSTFLEETYPERPEHYIYFSDGKGDGRDLQFIPREFPRVNELLAQINNQSSNLKYQYRNHEIQNVRGGSNKQQLDDWFQKEGSGLSAGDRLVIYVTAHGGKSTDKDAKENSRLHLWNGQSIDVKQFREWLEQIDSEVPIIVVMVQCYSGGFSNMIFEAGDASQGQPNRPWCGFYATVPDRVAAGCTPDTREENYHEYSTYLMEALRGRTRLGEPVEQPDFDGNGIITLDEAHAYVLIHSKTIDISMKTSDQYLRKIELAGLNDGDKLDDNSSFDFLLEHATLNQATVLRALSEELGLQGDRRADAARALGKRMESQKKAAEQQRRQISKDLQQAARALRGAISLRWPELANAWNPAAQTLMHEEGELILQAIEGHSSFGKFMELRQKMAQVNAEAMNADRRWVKCQRLIRTLESVALAGNLQEAGSLEQQEAYQRLIDLESSWLGNSFVRSAADTSGQP